MEQNTEVAAQTELNIAKPKETGGKKALRLVFSFVFTFIALIAFAVFFADLAVYKFTHTNVVQEVIDDIDIEETEIGALSGIFNNENIDKHSTIVETIAVLVIDTLDLDVDREVIEGMIADSDFRRSVNDLVDDISDAVSTGTPDLFEFGDDILALIDANAELIEALSGYDISNGLVQIKGNSDSVILKLGDMDDLRALLDTIENYTRVSKVADAGAAVVQNVEEKISYAQEATLYIFAGIGVLMMGLIILLNRRVLGTGFRFDAIIAMVAGSFWLIVGAIIGAIPGLVSGIFVAVSGLINPVGYFADIAGGLVHVLIGTVADSLKLGGGIMLLAGIGMLVLSIVLTSREKRYAGEA